MQKPLKILMLEDNETDAHLIRMELSKELDYEYVWARNKEQFVGYLHSYNPDVIISDNALPRFSGLEALDMARSLKSSIPFILVTGTVSEDYAVQILKRGADDYILKDRMVRLPSAIRFALEQKQTQQALSDYKYALDSASMVTITDGDGIITHANDIFCTVSGYSREELTGQDHRILNSGFHSSLFFKGLWSTIKNGKIWRDTICNRSKNGDLFWSDTSIIPFLDSSGIPYRYLTIRFDVSEKKHLERELLERQRKEQSRITATALAAQEKERNAIGIDLHDNVNQILAGALIFLNMAQNKPNANNEENIRTAVESIQQAILENRKIAHQLVSPDQKKNLVEQVEQMAEAMLASSGMQTHVYREGFDEQRLSDEIKLTVYRIMQEQFTNIIKYSKASSVEIRFTCSADLLSVSVADNGVGIETIDGRKGIGFRNIHARLSILNGYSEIHSAEGKGFRLDIRVPL